MPLTPMDIHNKEFSRSFRGYDEDEVDSFLDEVVEEFERLYKENLEIRDRISMLHEQITHYKTMENTLKETLITAQKTADEVIENAQKKGELIIKEAEDQGKQIVEEAKREVMEIQKESDELRKQMQVFKMRFKTLLETQLEMVMNEKDLFGE
ncbi:MAG: DivIVA domain-containing protein [Clostridia bacterium]|jgi:cell division initiation protein